MRTIPLKHECFKAVDTMNKLLFPLLLGALVLSGCAHQYVIKLSNGSQISTPSKPRLAHGNYYYKDALGRENTISAGRVVEVEPASIASEEAKQNQFVPQKPHHWYQFW